MHNILMPRCMAKKKLLEIFFAQKGFVIDRKKPHIAALDFKYLFTLKR